VVAVDGVTIDLLPGQRGLREKGGTMRLGLYPVSLAPGSQAAKVYGESIIHERHRHRYEVNNEYWKILEKNGLTISGVWQEQQRKYVAYWEICWTR